MSILISGGYSDGAPPLPIPNREVKPVRADGTASSGRVGSRRFFQKSPAFHTMWSAGFLVCIICMIRMKAGLAGLKGKNLISEVPLKDALNAFIFALNDSAKAFAALLAKKFNASS